MDFQTAILHIDGDSFFASCEISLNPKLRGKPVVTGQERGIATAISKEAKALGIHRGMPIFQIRKLYPQVVIAHSDYMIYSIFAQRMYDIVRRYTPDVEEYSIDECFADLTPLIGSKMPLKQGLEGIARSIKNTLQAELGMTFSVGLAPTKVLAKVASKWDKPDGFAVIYLDKINEFLNETQIGEIWGIGPQTSAYLQRQGVKTAEDFIERPEIWIREHVAKPYIETWHELRGNQMFRVHSDYDEDTYKSIQKTRTFTPPSRDKVFLFGQLSKNVESACAKLRLNNLSSRRIYYFLKTNEFRYHRKEIPLPSALNTPADILNEIKKTFDEVYKPGTTYRATGVTMSELVDSHLIQKDLFGVFDQTSRWQGVFNTVDELDHKFGSHSVVLGSSLGAFNKLAKDQSVVERYHNPITGSRKRLRIPYLGEVK